VKATLTGAAGRFQWLEQSRLDGMPLSTTTRKALALLSRTINEI
jgi:hypothetical protein